MASAASAALTSAWVFPDSATAWFEIAGGGDFFLLQILDAFEILRGVGGAGGRPGEIGGGLADERFVGGDINQHQLLAGGDAVAKVHAVLLRSVPPPARRRWLRPARTACPPRAARVPWAAIPRARRAPDGAQPSGRAGFALSALPHEASSSRNSAARKTEVMPSKLHGDNLTKPSAA